MLSSWAPASLRKAQSAASLLGGRTGRQITNLLPAHLGSQISTECGFSSPIETAVAIGQSLKMLWHFLKII